MTEIDPATTELTDTQQRMLAALDPVKLPLFFETTDTDGEIVYVGYRDVDTVYVIAPDGDEYCDDHAAWQCTVTFTHCIYDSAAIPVPNKQAGQNLAERIMSVAFHRQQPSCC